MFKAPVGKKLMKTIDEWTIAVNEKLCESKVLQCTRFHPNVGKTFAVFLQLYEKC